MPSTNEITTLFSYNRLNAAFRIRWHGDNGNGTPHTQSSNRANTAYDRDWEMFIVLVFLVDRSSGRGAWRACATGGLTVSQPLTHAWNECFNAVSSFAPFLNGLKWNVYARIRREKEIKISYYTICLRRIMFSRGGCGTKHTKIAEEANDASARQFDFSLIVTLIANARCAQFGRLDCPLIEIVRSRSGAKS